MYQSGILGPVSTGYLILLFSMLPLACVSVPLASSAETPSISGDGMVPLNVTYPHPNVRESVHNVPQLKNPDPETKGNRVPKIIRVPRDTVLLSEGKPVTASWESPIIGELSMITSRKPEYREFGMGDFVELGPGLQWAQIDLERECFVDAVLIWRFSWLSVTDDVIVQTSLEPAFEQNVTTLYNNDFDNSAGFGIGTDHDYYERCWGLAVPGHGVRARYVRFYSNGSSTNVFNRYSDVKIYGREVPHPAPGPGATDRR